MYTLHVRNVPAEIHASLSRQARARNTSISKETIRLLARALRTELPGVRRLLEEIERERPRARKGSPPAADLIREDRDAR